MLLSKKNSAWHLGRGYAYIVILSANFRNYYDLQMPAMRPNI